MSAAFALVWARVYQPALWKWAVAGSGLALALAATLRLAIPESHPYSLIAAAHELYWPLEARTVARRLLLCNRVDVERAGPARGLRARAAHP